MDHDAVRHRIEAAFADVRRDPEQSLHQAQLTDQGMARQIHGDEWRAAGERDVATDWREVPGEHLDDCDAALSHCTQASWRFYLPAYMCRAMDRFVASEPDDDLLNRVVWQLTGVDRHDVLNPYLTERFDALSEAQADAVHSFLRWVEAESLRLIETTNDSWWTYNDVKIALASYWVARVGR